VVVTEKSKVCLDCHQSLCVSSFHRKGLYWDSRCKPCVLKRKKDKYVVKNKQKIKTYKNIIIMPSTNEVDINGYDLASLLESFLLEECVSVAR